MNKEPKQTDQPKETRIQTSTVGLQHLPLKIKRPKRHKRGYDLWQIERIAAAGLTNAQICLTLGITDSTLWRWKREASFQAAWKRGIEHSAAIVEKSLYQSAIGFHVEELTHELKPVIRASGKNPAVYSVADAEEERLILTKRTIKAIAPNVIAQIFYLKNKDPKNWKDRTDATVSQSALVRIQELSNMRVEDVLKLAQEIRGALDERTGTGSAQPATAAPAATEATSPAGVSTDDPGSDQPV